jgi:hypothetical protein
MAAFRAMRILCVIVSALGLLLLTLAWRGWSHAQERRADAAEVQQALTELQRLVRMYDRSIQPLPDDFTTRLDDRGILLRDWSVVAVIGAVVFLSGVTGIYITRRPPAVPHNAA